MSPESVFSFGSSFVFIGWILLLVFPNWKFTQAIVLNGVIVILAILYAYIFVKDMGSFDPKSFSTLSNVKVLFQNDNAVAAGWLHYLTFDLLVGAYIVKQCQKLEISRWSYSLILPFTFMFGPIGYFIFFVIKFLKTKSFANID
jgi:hypothetical protein